MVNIYGSIYGDYMINIWRIYGEYMDNLWIWLVVEPAPLKNMKVNWDAAIPNIWKKTCSKPPTR